MVNEIIGKISGMNINSDSIGPILIIVPLMIAIAIKLFTQIKEFIVKTLKAIIVVTVVVCCIAIKLGVLEDWVNKLSTYIK